MCGHIYGVNSSFIVISHVSQRVFEKVMKNNDAKVVGDRHVLNYALHWHFYLNNFECWAVGFTDKD